MKQVFWYMFVLILVLILVAYYKGTTSDISTGGSALQKLILTLQGRNSKGNFASYPGGS
ncbi:hypothetical protein [Alicyclobacillus shizuokensis]|uniref:hypothetical protein n=1 Tax=Alicyclobacillus shizuokensis TaxID=392014 RepID=UPI000AADE45E|nr:hypothetical protein [Alicyclobacillus shizuokensis]